MAEHDIVKITDTGKVLVYRVVKINGPGQIFCNGVDIGAITEVELTYKPVTEDLL